MTALKLARVWCGWESPVSLLDNAVFKPAATEVAMGSVAGKQLRQKTAVWAPETPSYMGRPRPLTAESSVGGP